MRYTKLPVTIDAVLWDGAVETLDELGSRDGDAHSVDEKGTLYIATLEGEMAAHPGAHYVVRGVNGELYPVRRDIFEKTYRPSGDEVSAESAAVPTAAPASQPVSPLPPPSPEVRP